MAEPYLERLSQMVEVLEPPLTRSVTLECKHFFSGAALYANGKICASLSPAGFAVKLPEEERETLISEGTGMEFRFFANGPIKRDYVALSESIMRDKEALRDLISMSAKHVVALAD